MGVPLLLGIIIYVIIISVLAIWLKGYHNHVQLFDPALRDENENFNPEKPLKRTINRKKNSFENNSQTMLKSGNCSESINKQDSE